MVKKSVADLRALGGHAATLVGRHHLRPDYLARPPAAGQRLTDNMNEVDPNPDASPVTVEELIRETSEALIRTQRDLDRSVNPDHPLLVHIPRVEARFAFELTRGENRSFLMFFGKKRRSETLSHHLRFALSAAPDPTPLFHASASMNPETVIDEPSFLLPEGRKAPLSAPSVQSIRDEVLRLVERALNGEHTILLRFMVKPPMSRLASELEELAAPDARFVALSLGGPPTRFMLVRLGDKATKDGLFVYTPAAQPSLSVYSFKDDGRDKVAYEPLHWLALTLRRWTASRSSRRRVAAGGFTESLGIGSADGDLGRFIRELASAYRSTTALLADSRVDSRTHEPIYYTISGLEADLSYSVHDGKRISFDERPDGDSDLSIIESQVKVSIRRRDNRPVVNVAVEAPEFILVDEKLRMLTRAILEGQDRLLDTLPNQGERERYRSFLENKAFSAKATALLSYEGDRPKNEFVVVWPGTHQDHFRDFVFRCKLRTRDDMLEMSDPRFLVTLDQPVSGLTMRTQGESDGSLSGADYEAFHNFFHAVRMWRDRAEE